MVVVELIQTYHISSLSCAILIEVTPIVLESIKILSDSLNELLKAWVRLGTCPIPRAIKTTRQNDCIVSDFNHDNRMEQALRVGKFQLTLNTPEAQETLLLPRAARDLRSRPGVPNQIQRTKDARLFA